MLEAIKFYKNIAEPIFDINSTNLVEDAKDLARSFLDDNIVDQYKDLNCHIFYIQMNEEKYLDNLFVVFHNSKRGYKYLISLNEYSYKFRKNILSPKYEFVVDVLSRIHIMLRIFREMKGPAHFDLTQKDDIECLIDAVNSYEKEVSIPELNITDIRVMVDYLYEMSDEE